MYHCDYFAAKIHGNNISEIKTKHSFIYISKVTVCFFLQDAILKVEIWIKTFGIFL